MLRKDVMVTNLDILKKLREVPQKRQFREAEEQEALFLWADLQACIYPELLAMYAIPNGGSRHKIEAYNLKKQGVKAGLPDICLPIRRKGFIGLYIELKVGKNKTSEHQEKWIERLRKHGHRVEVCYGWEKAKDIILDYLKN
jgi:hypothetical protein